MGNPTPSRAPRPYSPDAIDTEPLQGRGRNEFEAGLFIRVKRSQQLVLRIILDHAAGKADCWPGNKRIADIAGYQVRNVQIIMRALEVAQVIRCAVDRSLETQRRIVLLDHPHAITVLNRLGDRPWMHVGAQKSAPGTTPKPAQRVDAGAQTRVGAGAQTRVGAGAQSSPAKSSPEFNPQGGTPGGFLPPLERRKTPSAAKQLADLEAWIATRATGSTVPIVVCSQK